LCRSLQGRTAHSPGWPEGPEEIVLELGITLDAELGAVLAKAKGGAQLKVTLKWRNES
jgi:hypothetical protein